MGTLVVMTYPTSLFAKAADHTYVKCHTGGAAWGCWGGKSGGKTLRSGQGSTKRADKIAQPDEKANIKCYLVNGVCHQAANRILLPADILVRGARGYSVSQALFGAYGRVGIWPCRSPFVQHAGVTGDLTACRQAAALSGRRARRRQRSEADKLDYQYIRRELEIYRGGARMMRSGARSAADASEAASLHLALFMHMAEFNLGPMLDRGLARRLKQVRRKTERDRRKPEIAYESKEMNIEEFAGHFNELTLLFQTEMANSMNRDTYATLFDLDPDQQVILADPQILGRVKRG